MIVLIDTNILLVSVSPKSPKHWVYRKFLDQEYQLAVSTEIFLEYEEILGLYMNAKVAETTTKAIAHAGNTILVTKWYSWNLINADPDDNKFVDTYIAAGADYIVTEDAHFDVLKSITFPVVKVIGLETFGSLLKNSK
jgi:putative PIN family toxin of toxin-antitoxin system